MATFGNTHAGVSLGSIGSATSTGIIFNKASNGQISKVSARLYNTDAANDLNVKIAIYDAAKNKVATFNTITVIKSDTGSWYDANILTGGNLAAGNYYIVLCADDDSKGGIFFDADTSQEYLDGNWVGYASFPPATYNASNNVTNQNWSVYATYTPPVSGGKLNQASKLLEMGLI